MQKYFIVIAVCLAIVAGLLVYVAVSLHTSAGRLENALVGIQEKVIESQHTIQDQILMTCMRENRQIGLTCGSQCTMAPLRETCLSTCLESSAIIQRKCLETLRKSRTAP